MASQVDAEEQITADFTQYADLLELEHTAREEVRQVVKELNVVVRSTHLRLQAVHKPAGLHHVPTMCASARSTLLEARPLLDKLRQLIPAGQFYRYHDAWRYDTQRLVFLAALLEFLEHERLVRREAVAALLGLDAETGFHLDLEDYLHGLLMVPNELARLAVNCVTAGDFALPVRIAAFATDLEAGFRLLNFKNDALRKRYDGLKYDLRRMEEVVYDVTLRGLAPRGSTAAAPDQ